MSLRDAAGREARRNHPIATEFAVVAAVLVGLWLWQRLLNGVLSTVLGRWAPVDGLLLTGLLGGGLFVGGVVVFAVVYAGARDLSPGLALPSRADLPWVALAAGAPIGLVAVTKLAGVVAGVPYNSLTHTAVAADAPLGPVLTVAGLGLLVGVPSLVVVCQVLVQGSFRRVVDRDAAVVLTTAVTGFVAIGDTGGLSAVPDRGTLAGTVLFVGLLGLGLFADGRLLRGRRRVLAYVPVGLFGLLVGLSAVAEVTSVVAGLFVLSHLATLALAALAYDRTDSLAPPALAYAALLLANRAVVVLFEAGMQNW